VGTGFIGPIHIEALHRLGIRVKGILGSTPVNSEKARQKWGLEIAYPNLEAILKDTEITAVHLAVPNILHFEMAKKSLLAGKHVMCEKPLAMNSKETGELVSLAEKSRLVAGVCYNVRYYPLNLELRQRFSSGNTGRIFSVTGSYVQDWLAMETDYNWRVLAKHSGPLRAVADIGTHWVDLITFITGLRVKAVFADLSRVYDVRKKPVGEVETFANKSPDQKELEDVNVDTEDLGSVLFRFEGGSIGALWVSQVTPGRKNCIRYEMATSKHTFAWNSELPNELWIGNRSKPNQSLVKDPSIMAAQVLPFANYPGGHNEGYPDTFKQCFRAFYQAIIHPEQQKNPFYPTFLDGHRKVVLCNAILQSDQEERWMLL
jgi:predicted dehydrogenase